MKAIWDSDYDSRTDSIYKRPCCPECREPIYKEVDRYLYVSCGEVVEVTDPKMLKWFKKREEVKFEMHDCPRIPLENGEYIGCGSKGTLKVMYVRNNVTLEWQPAMSECSVCGLKSIV